MRLSTSVPPLPERRKYIADRLPLWPSTSRAKLMCQADWAEAAYLAEVFNREGIQYVSFCWLDSRN